MQESNKTVLQKANAAVSAGDNEGFLSLCADDIVWTTVGAGSLHGKAAVREWMTKEYVTPPQFTIHSLIADADFVVALGDIMSVVRTDSRFRMRTATSGDSRENG